MQKRMQARASQMSKGPLAIQVITSLFQVAAVALRSHQSLHRLAQLSSHCRTFLHILKTLSGEEWLFLLALWLGTLVIT